MTLSLRVRRLALVAAAALLALVAVRPPGVSGQAPSGDVTFRLIVVSSTDRAEGVLEQLTTGGDFIAIARAQSLDPSAAQGGTIGPVDPAALLPALRDTLRVLTIGQVSGIVPLPTGFAVLQRIAAPPAPQATIGTGEIPALAAAGGVKYTLSVDGFAEANSALDGFDKPADWNQSPRLVCDMRQASLARSRSVLTQLLGPGGESARAGSPPLDVVEAHFALAQLHAYDGAMDRAIDEFERARAVAQRDVPSLLPQLEEALGIAHLHKAEMDNGVYHEPGDRCLLPSRSRRPFTKTADLEQAIAHFQTYLATASEELEVKWLLNLAYMALGGYPEQVPPRHLIPPSALESAEDVGRFTDVAAGAGVAAVSSAGGVAIDDFDNDGRLDILTSNFDSCGAMQLFSRRGAGPFADRATQAGLGGELGGLNLAQADYNNDGCRDVLVMRGGWEIAQRRSLLRNNCDGTFTEVTEAAGLARPATSSQTAAWTDVDNDGLLDLFVGNEDRPSQLFRNQGNGTFTDIAAAAGVARSAFTKGVTAGDFDNDGYPDLYVSNLGGGNFLYRNNHDLTFTDVVATAGVPGADRGFATWFFDYDNDGWEDLLVSSYVLSIDETVRTYLRLPHNATTMKLYRNLGNGTFRDVSAQAGLGKVFMPMGSNFGDIDNDGFLDIYLGVGSPSYAAMGRSVLLRNRGGQSFVDVTASSGTGELHKGHGVAFADLDNDGDEDIVFRVGGATPGDAHALRLFENPGHGNDWLALKLVGVKSNRAAIGARITVTVEQTGGGTRAIHRTVNSGGSFGASPLEQHIGLGTAARIADVEVWWPASGTRQHVAGVEKNQAIEVTEQAAGYRRLERPRLPLVEGRSAARVEPAGPATVAGRTSPYARTSPYVRTAFSGRAGSDQGTRTDPPARTFTVRGMVLRIDPPATLVVSHDRIEGLMDSMTMPFDVRDRRELEGVVPGAIVEFSLVVGASSSYATSVRIRRYESVEQDPRAARRLGLLDRLMRGTPNRTVVGQPVRDFTLVDAQGQSLTLSSLRGKVVVVNFVYTRCALPQFCLRMSTTFAALQRRFTRQFGKDLALLTITFDPARDTPEVLAAYAAQWKADPAIWRFLTGRVADVRRVCAEFGLEAFPDEGLMNHSLQTAVIDRRGTLAATVTGNQFTPEQLGDLVLSVLER